MKTYQIQKASMLWGQPHHKAYELNGKWFIDINSLEELEELEGKGNGVAGIVIYKGKITIYDDYIE